LCAVGITELGEAALPISVDCIKKDLENCIAYMKHPFRRWRHIRTTNIIERGFKEVKRRVKV